MKRNIDSVYFIKMGETVEQIWLSFVVPCYNVEHYIQRCLDSIFACGLPETSFEVLCIDDCSPDGTAEILEMNALVHSNLRIITHKYNKGLGGGRNTGIREAKGRFLWFVDSDDEIIADGFAEALQQAVRERLDILCFNYCRIDEGGKELSRHVVFDYTTAIDGYAFVKEVFGDGLVYHMGYVVRFLYRTQYLISNDLFFPENVHWEDTVFMPKSLLQSECVASVPQVFYAYRINPDSISGVFERAYPAKSIYDFSFCVGGELLQYSDEVMDECLRTALRNFAIHKYINGFAIHLFRTSKQERKRFFELLKEREREVKPMKQYLSTRNMIMLMPCVGPVIAELLSFGYKKTHKQKYV